MLDQLPVRSLLPKVLSSFAVITSFGFAVLAQLPVSAASLTPVDLELSLLVDVSGSINSREYALQMSGYRNAFTRLAPQFGSGGFGSVAVNFIQWSGRNQQEQSIPWMLLNDQASALQFANLISTLVRPRSTGTDPDAAIRFATPLFSSNAYDGQSWVIDVSGDGIGGRFTSGRDEAVAAGVVINGLPVVLSPNSGLEAWYRRNVQGGTGSFTIAANGFEDFDRAVEQKLTLELTRPQAAAVPEPTTMLGIALAGGGLAYLKRRQRSI